MKTILVVRCDFCDRRFERPLGHINMNKKLNHKNYCSKECRSKVYSKRMSGENNPMYGVRRYGKNNPMYGDHRFAGENSPMFGRCGKDSPRYNKHHTEAIKEKIRLSRIGRKATPEARKRMSESHVGLQAGKDNPNYKDGRTPKNKLERNTPENKQFIQDILKRDNFTCQTCYQYSGKLNIDHIMPWSLYPKLRHVSENVRTLCISCHRKYGAKPNAKPEKYATSPVS